MDRFVDESAIFMPVAFPFIVCMIWGGVMIEKKLSGFWILPGSVPLWGYHTYRDLKCRYPKSRFRLPAFLAGLVVYVGFIAFVVLQL